MSRQPISSAHSVGLTTAKENSRIICSPAVKDSVGLLVGIAGSGKGTNGVIQYKQTIRRGGWVHSINTIVPRLFTLAPSRGKCSPCSWGLWERRRVRPLKMSPAFQRCKKLYFIPFPSKYASLQFVCRSSTGPTAGAAAFKFLLNKFLKSIHFCVNFNFFHRFVLFALQFVTLTRKVLFT